jgi:probable F420-dependent oxidoreductase
MEISVVAAAREDDRPPLEALAVASIADQLGYPEVWLGEGPTWDAFVLATAIGRSTERIAITVGPVPVSVRDAATISRAAASTAALIGRPVGVALGTSSVRVVEGVHGRSRAGARAVLADSASRVRASLDRNQSEPEARPVHGFRRRLAPAGGSLTVAAVGDRAIAIAAEHADRMLLDLVSPEQVRLLRDKLDAAARQSGRESPRLAAWLPTAIDPDPDSYAQMMRSIVGYLAVPHQAEMFIAAGFGAAVEKARTGADPAELLNALPLEAASVVGLVGSAAAVRARLHEYEQAGLDEAALVPATAGDPAGERTLTALSGQGGRPKP